MVALLLKQQIQKNLSTFCHLCLVQPVNSSLACHLHVKVSYFPILRGKKFFAPENGGGEGGRAGVPLPHSPFSTALGQLEAHYSVINQ